MNNRRPPSISDELRLDRAVRRSVGMRFAIPSMRSLLKACGVYANVFAAVVALGIPTVVGLRSSGMAALAFDTAVRSSRSIVKGLPDLLGKPVDLTSVTEFVEVVPSARFEPVINDAPAVAPRAAMPATTSVETTRQLQTGFEFID